jgi:hypothetical protein
MKDRRIGAKIILALVIMYSLSTAVLRITRPRDTEFAPLEASVASQPLKYEPNNTARSDSPVSLSPTTTVEMPSIPSPGDNGVLEPESKDKGFEQRQDGSYLDQFLDSKQGSGSLGYRVVLDSFSKSDVPELFRLLGMSEYVGEWLQITMMIGWLCRSTPDDATDGLTEFISRPESWDTPRVGNAMLASKVRALDTLGYVGGAEAGAFLRQAFSDEGARAIREGWTDGPFPPPWDEYPECLVLEIRGRAALGLILTRDTDNIQEVQDAYRVTDAEMRSIQDYPDLCYSSRDKLTPHQLEMEKFYGDLIQSMADNDLINDIGMDEFINLQGTTTYSEKVCEYINQYTSWFSYAPTGLRVY